MLLNDAWGYPQEDGWAPLDALMTPASFQLFSRKYFEEQNEKGRPGFDPLFAPLWYVVLVKIINVPDLAHRRLQMYIVSRRSFDSLG